MQATYMHGCNCANNHFTPSLEGFKLTSPARTAIIGAGTGIASWAFARTFFPEYQTPIMIAGGTLGTIIGEIYDSYEKSEDDGLDGLGFDAETGLGLGNAASGIVTAASEIVKTVIGVVSSVKAKKEALKAQAKIDIASYEKAIIDINSAIALIKSSIYQLHEKAGNSNAYVLSQVYSSDLNGLLSRKSYEEIKAEQLQSQYLKKYEEFKLLNIQFQSVANQYGIDLSNGTQLTAGISQYILPLLVGGGALLLFSNKNKKQ